MEEEKVKKTPKKNHRGHNEGSIYQRSDKRWVGQVQVGFKEDGSRKFVTYYGKSRKEVADKISEARNDILKGSFIKPNDITVEEWFWNWMVTYKFKNVSSTTYARYLIYMKNHIVPKLGKMRLQDIKAMHIQKILNDCSSGGMGASSVKHIRTIFNQALELAFKQEMIPKNWTDYTTLPKSRKVQDVVVFTREEQEKIIGALKIDPIGILIRLAISTDAREGELLGLSWDDVDFENKTINIRQALVKERKFSEDGRKVTGRENMIGAVKTLTSNRVIPIADNVCTALQKYKLIQRAFLRSNIRFDDDIPNMVFLGVTGSYWDQSNMIKHYCKFLKDLDIPYRKFHALRHTFATRIMEANVHPKVAQELLGHASVDITMNVYSHVLPEQKREAIDKIKEIV